MEIIPSLFLTKSKHHKLQTDPIQEHYSVQRRTHIYIVYITNHDATVSRTIKEHL